QITLVASTQAFLQPMPVSRTAISASPILEEKHPALAESTLINRRSFRQGANSASTANVTRMRMALESKNSSAQAEACATKTAYAAFAYTIFLARRGLIYPLASYQRTARSSAARTEPG